MRASVSRLALPIAGAAATVTAVWLGVVAALAPQPPLRLLVAPMIGLEPCVSPTADTVSWDLKTQQQLFDACWGANGSSGRLVEDTVGGLETPGSPRPRYDLGYTLNIPLLKLFKPAGAGWDLDRDLIGRLARTVRDVQRPVVLYLFSTHFEQKAPIEPVLAADPVNLSWTQQGPLANSLYYGAPIYNWGFARTDTPVTARRVEAARAMLEAVCALGPEHVRKVRGLTLLGETHHLFPDFEAGMGFEKPYLITDYSPASRAGFRAFLRQRFGTVDQLNEALGSGWKSFDEIEPPAKDIRQSPLRDYTEHIDAFAHGSLPITGWAWRPGMGDASPGWVRVYRNGELASRLLVNKGRQDVLAALPQLGTANTGWRYDLDFRGLPAGLHQIDVLLEDGAGGLVQLASRTVAIMDKRQATPESMPVRPLPPSRPLAEGPGQPRGSVDVPRDHSSYFYNPMVPLWHAYRGQQVVRYLQYFSNAVRLPCLDGVPHYTHQIIPFTNPGWDETRFAIEPSLQPLPGIAMGISLYGDPTYGRSFLDWHTQSRRGVADTAYGITEFHPLKALDPGQMAATFDQHARQGAKFLSFFMEPRWQGRKVSLHTNPFSLDPANPQFGSDVDYASVRAVLAGQATPQPVAAPPGVTVPAARSTP